MCNKIVEGFNKLTPRGKVAMGVVAAIALVASAVAIAYLVKNAKQLNELDKVVKEKQGIADQYRIAHHPDAFKRCCHWAGISASSPFWELQKAVDSADSAYYAVWGRSFGVGLGLAVGSIVTPFILGTTYYNSLLEMPRKNGGYQQRGREMKEIHRDPEYIADLHSRNLERGVLNRAVENSDCSHE